MLVGLGHRKQVGKDTAAQILVEKYGFHRIAFADTLKGMALEINPLIEWSELGTFSDETHLVELVEEEGWEMAKRHPRVRTFLQNLGVAARKWLGQNVWVDSAFAAMHLLKGRGVKDFVITDVRFWNEFYAIRKERGVLVRINRAAAPNDDTHVSEVELEDAPWDYEIHNDGTVDELEKQLVEVLGL